MKGEVNMRSATSRVRCGLALTLAVAAFSGCSASVESSDQQTEPSSTVAVEPSPSDGVDTTTSTNSTTSTAPATSTTAEGNESSETSTGSVDAAGCAEADKVLVEANNAPQGDLETGDVSVAKGGDLPDAWPPDLGAPEWMRIAGSGSFAGGRQMGFKAKVRTTDTDTVEVGVACWITDAGWTIGEPWSEDPDSGAPTLSAIQGDREIITTIDARDDSTWVQVNIAPEGIAD